MTDLTQTAQWIAGGFIGQIPVWDSSGEQIGYRTDYNSNIVIFNAKYRGDTQLFTKDFYGNDVQFNLPAQPKGATGDWTTGEVTGNTPTAPIIGGVTGVISPTVAANYPAGSLNADYAAGLNTFTSALDTAANTIQSELNSVKQGLQSASNFALFMKQYGLYILGGLALVLIVSK